MTTGLRFPLVCFDLDGTLVDDTVYIWTTLHEGFGTDAAARQRAHDDFFAQRITYREWLAHDFQLLRAAGATRDSMLAFIDRLKPMRGAFETLHELRRRGHRIAIVSGSLDIVVTRLFGDFPFDHVLINRIDFDDDGHITGGEHTPYDVQNKAAGLHELCRREGIAPSQAVFVGDNENDLWIAEAAGRSIAFNCKSDRLAQLATYVVTEKDLRQVLPLIE
ncbi:MAG: HAD family phosphatase [Proteobacteria bacterium]|nr:HAD family phosphatase [Pseudomonadota bacterium]